MGTLTTAPTAPNLFAGTVLRPGSQGAAVLAVQQLSEQKGMRTG